MGSKINRNLLRQARKRKRWSQEMLAESSGLHPRTIQRIERTGIASVQSYVAIANALEIPVEELENNPGEQLFSSWWASIVHGIQSVCKDSYLKNIEQIPPSVGVVALLWFLGGISDLARGSLLWLAPAFFCIILSYKLIMLRPAWRIAALVLNWLFVSGIILALMIFTLQFIDGSVSKAYIDILENSLFEPYVTLILLYLLAALMVMVFAWQNNVLYRPEIRRLFNRRNSKLSDGNTR